MTPKDILLIALGSAGDVHPFVGISLELVRRGHTVTVAANPKFEALIRGSNLGFHPVGTVEEYDRITENPDLWHPTKGFKMVAEFGFLAPMPTVYEFIRERFRPGKTIVAAHSIALGARIAQEKLGVPTATIHLAPAVFRSAYQAPNLHPLTLPDGMPKFMKRSIFWFVDKALIDPLMAKRINAYRREVGLTGRVKRVMNEWWLSPDRVIGMFPPFFGPPQPDWPPQTRLTSFPLYDGRGFESVPPELESFLAAGDPPIVFTPGSANQHAREFFEIAVAACAPLGRRGVLLSRYAENVPANLPPAVQHCRYAPLSHVLPRSAALVSHGGIGTVAQAFSAGVPQIVMALAHDQFDNATRVARLGTGRWIKSTRFTEPWLTRSLGELLSDPAVHARCAEYKRILAGHNAITETADLIEELGGNDAGQARPSAPG